MFKEDPSATLLNQKIISRPSQQQHGGMKLKEMNPAKDLMKKMEIIKSKVKKQSGSGIRLAGGGIRLAGGGKKKVTVRKPKGMPPKVANFIKRHPKLALKIVNKLKTQRGSGVSDVLKTIAKTVLAGLSASVKTAAKEMFEYALQNPKQVIDFIMKVLNQMGEDSPEEQMALLQAIDPELQGADEGPAFFMEGEGLKKEFKKVKKGVKKAAKKTGKAAKKTGKFFESGAKELVKHPSQRIGQAGDVLGVAALVPGPQQPVVRAAALGAKGTSKVLKMAGKGKRKPSAYNVHMKVQMGKGLTMKQAAALWKKK